MPFSKTRPVSSKYKTFSDDIHMIIHSLRLIPNYKPSVAEIKISKLVSELYSTQCKECSIKHQEFTNQPEAKQKMGFMQRISNALEESE